MRFVRVFLFLILSGFFSNLGLASHDDKDPRQRNAVLLRAAVMQFPQQQAFTKKRQPWPKHRKKFIPLPITLTDSFETAQEITAYLNQNRSIKDSLLLGNKKWKLREKTLFEVALLACKTKEAKKAFLSELGLNENFFSAALICFEINYLKTVAKNLQIENHHRGEVLRQMIFQKYKDLCAPRFLNLKGQ